MSHPSLRYIPALRYNWLTPNYDSFVHRVMPESLFMGRLVEQARIQPGYRVLDLGCGTATLALFLKQTHPEAEVVGLDADPRVFEIAKEKAANAGIHMVLVHGMACALPYADNFFDRVLSSLLFHHVNRHDKLCALQEAFRVLRPGGGLHIADWGKAEDRRMRTAFLLVQCLDGFKTTADNVHGVLPELLSEAGFASVRESEWFRTVFGTLSLYQAEKPVAYCQARFCTRILLAIKLDYCPH